MLPNDDVNFCGNNEVTINEVNDDLNDTNEVALEN